MTKLKPIHLHILRVLSQRLAERPDDPELSTMGVAEKLPMNVVLWHMNENVLTNYYGFILALFAANNLPQLLRALREGGYVLRRPNPDSEHHRRSLWRLGPMADKLKEEGVLE